MYRKSIYENKDTFKSSLYAIEELLSADIPVTNISEKLSSRFQEKEIDGLLTSVKKIFEVNPKPPQHKWLKISSIIFFLLMLGNTILLFGVVSLGIQAGTDFSKLNTDFSLSLFFSFFGVLFTVPLVINSFKETYFWYTSSSYAMIAILLIINETFVIFTYKSIFFYLPYIFFIMIGYIYYKIYIKGQRQHYLYLKRKIEKSGFDLSKLKSYLNN
jgi:hypothetical protein